MKITVKEQVQFAVAGSVWGTISGTLSNQVDLQVALDGRVPYTGATADVSLGIHGLNAYIVRSNNYQTGSGNQLLTVGGAGAVDLSSADALSSTFGTTYALNGFGISLISISGSYFKLFDLSNVLSASISSRTLYDILGNASIDWANGYLYSSPGVIALDYTNFFMFDAAQVGSINWDSRTAHDTSGNISIDWSLRELTDSSAQATLNWSSGDLIYGGVNSLSWGGRSLSNSSGISVVSWENKLLYTNNGTQHAVLDWGTQKLFDITDQTSIEWTNRLAYASNGATVMIDWSASTGAKLPTFIQVGRTARDLVPISAIHVDRGTAQASALRFTSGTVTGTTATDGVTFGVTAGGTAEIRQYENQSIIFYTNNTSRLSITGAGSFAFADATTMSIGTTTGLKIGTSTSEKLAFFGNTPILQSGPNTDLGGVLSDFGLRAASTSYTLATSGAVTFSGLLTLTDNNCVLGTTTGTKWGTATTQKQSFWNSTPIVQPANTVAIDTLLVNTGLRASGGVALFDTDVKVGVVGKGIYVKEGSNATMGVATLVAGTVVVSTTKVTATSRIQLTAQSLGTITVPVGYAVSARTAGTSFTILSGNALDTSVISWLLLEPS